MKKDISLYVSIVVAALSIFGSDLASASLARGLTPQPLRVSHCSTSTSSCGFYQCAEEVFQCGLTGYLLSVGAPLCNPEAYTNTESEQMIQFTQNVRKCLQEQIIQLAPTVRNCADLKAKALHSHIPCFVEYGFCDLTMAERRGVFKSGPTQFLKIAGVSKILAMTHELVKACYKLKHGKSHE